VTSPAFDPHEHLAAVDAGMQAVFERDPSAPGWMEDAMRLTFLIHELPVPPGARLVEAFEGLVAGSELAHAAAARDVSAIRKDLRARLVRAGFIA